MISEVSKGWNEAKNHNSSHSAFLYLCMNSVIWAVLHIKGATWQPLPLEGPSTFLLESGCVWMDFWCVNGFLMRCVQRKRHGVSSREIIDSDTSRIDSISCSLPFHKPHRFLCPYCMFHTQLQIQTVFVILWKHLCRIDLSWLWLKSRLCWKRKCTLGPFAAPDEPRKMFQVTAGIFRDCWTQVFTLQLNLGWIWKSNESLVSIRLLILLD